MPASALPKKDEPPAIAPDGVDVTLIRWMLSLTPAQRLQVLEQFVREVEKIRARRVRD